MRLTHVRTNPPRQLRMPADLLCDQSPCIRAKASWMCPGWSGVLASGGWTNNELAGSGISASSVECSRLRLLPESSPGLILRFPKRGEAMWSSRRYDSSRAFLTSSAATVRERTISKARNPTISVVSSLDLRSRCVGKFRNSLNRLAERRFVQCRKVNVGHRNSVTDLCDRKMMLVDSPNNVGTPRASSAL